MTNRDISTNENTPTKPFTNDHIITERNFNQCNPLEPHAELTSLSFFLWYYFIQLLTLSHSNVRSLMYLWTVWCTSLALHHKYVAIASISIVFQYTPLHAIQIKDSCNIFALYTLILIHIKCLPCNPIAIEDSSQPPHPLKGAS